MSRRSVVVTVLLALGAPLVHASDDALDRVCIPETVPRIASPRAEVTPAPTVLDRGVGAPMGPMDIIVARIGPDGKVITACVDSEEAARKFLETPVQQLRTKQAEQ